MLEPHLWLSLSDSSHVSDCCLSRSGRQRKVATTCENRSVRLSKMNGARKWGCFGNRRWWLTETEQWMNVWTGGSNKELEISRLHLVNPSSKTGVVLWFPPMWMCTTFIKQDSVEKALCWMKLYSNKLKKFVSQKSWVKSTRQTKHADVNLQGNVKPFILLSPPHFPSSLTDTLS